MSGLSFDQADALSDLVNELLSQVTARPCYDSEGNRYIIDVQVSGRSLRQNFFLETPQHVADFLRGNVNRLT